MRKTAFVLITAFAVSAGAGGLLAQSAEEPKATPIPAPAPDLSTPENQQLSCLANGQAYTPGEIACVPGCHGRQRLARCDAISTTADWTTLSDNCPTARLTPLPPGNPAYPTVMACSWMTNAPYAQVQ
jgi:hypothetical protein